MRVGMTPRAPTTTASYCICLTRPAARPALTTHVVDGFPLLECSLDGNKILVLGIFRMLFDGSASPGKPSAPSGANRVFRKHLGQGFGELSIKNGNVGGAGHVFVASQRLKTKNEPPWIVARAPTTAITMP